MSMLKSALLQGFLVLSVYSQTFTVTSPTAGSSVSKRISLTGTASSLPALASVEWFCDGESQGIVYAAPWSVLAWNTNNRYNGLTHQCWAVAKNSAGATLATATPVTFTIANSYLEPQSYIALSTCTPSTSTSSTWSGMANISCLFTGTNAANKKDAKLYVDGDYAGFTVLSKNTATTMNVNVDTTRYQDGPHQIILVFNDSQSTACTGYTCGGIAPTSGGFPFGEWDAAAVQFANTSTIRLKNIFANGDNVGSATYSTFKAPASGTVVTTAGSLLLFCVGNFQGGTVTPSNTLGYTWTSILTGTSQSNWNQKCWYSVNIAGGNDSFTASFSGGNAKGPTVLVREYSGAATSSPIDTQITSTGTSPAACACTIQSGTFTTTNANDAIALFYQPNVNGVIGLPGLNSFESGPLTNAVATDQFVSATISGGTASVGTSNVTNTVYGMTVVAIKAASATAQPQPSGLTISPVEAVIPSSGTLQVTPKILNSDGTNTTVTSAFNPAYSVAGGGSNGVTPCSISSSGLISGVPGTFGWCQVTLLLGNGITRTVAEWVSDTNVIHYFGTDGHVHTSGGTPLWLASMFFNKPPQGFQDQNKTFDQFGIAYKLAGFNTLEGAITQDGKWGTSCTQFATALNTYLTGTPTKGLVTQGILPLLSTYDLYWHPSAGSGQNFTDLYHGLYGPAGASAPCSTPPYQTVAQQHSATGRLVALSIADEIESIVKYPIPPPYLSLAGVILTCNTATPVICTTNWPTPPGPTGEASSAFIITGATGHSVLNNTLGGTMYNRTGVTSLGWNFTGPAGASGITVTTATDPNIIFQLFANSWKDGTFFVPYDVFAQIRDAFHAGGGILAGAPKQIAPYFAQAGWGYGNVPYFPSRMGDFSEIYQQPVNTFGPSQYTSLSSILSGGGYIYNQDHAYIHNQGQFGAFLQQTTFTNVDYGFSPAPVVSGVSAVGALVTWPSPHGITNIIPQATRVTFSGSSNSYFNANFYIYACPTSTTCQVYPTGNSVAGPASGGLSTIHWDDGTTISACPTPSGGPTSTKGFLNSGGSCNGGFSGAWQVYAGHTFTITLATGANASYWNGNTFILYNCAIPYTNCTPGLFIEIPPNSQVSGSMSAALYINNDYVRGQDLNVIGEVVGGPRTPFASIMACILFGCAGHRGYSLGADYSALAAQGCAECSAFGTLPCNDANALNCNQAAGNPFYPMGDADLVRTYWSAANANLIAKRLAAAGYLYTTRGPAPDLGNNIISAGRQGPKGNLLMTMNFQDGPATAAVDLSAYNVAGQKKVRYAIDRTRVDITELSSGVVSDVITLPAGGAVFYLCPNNESAEYNPPIVSARLADVPNATKILVHYGYVPFLMDQETSNVKDCSTGSACVIPVDRNIATVYGRITWLDVAGKVLQQIDAIL